MVEGPWVGVGWHIAVQYFSVIWVGKYRYGGGPMGGGGWAGRRKEVVQPGKPLTDLLFVQN